MLELLLQILAEEGLCLLCRSQLRTELGKRRDGSLITSFHVILDLGDRGLQRLEFLQRRRQIIHAAPHIGREDIAGQRIDIDHLVITHIVTHRVTVGTAVVMDIRQRIGGRTVRVRCRALKEILGTDIPLGPLALVVDNLDGVRIVEFL